MGVSGIVLAGGRSTRMGKDKTLMAYQNETMIERVVRGLRNVADEIIIASNSTAKYGIPGTVEVPDLYLNMGPLGGIHAGLTAASHPRSFVVAADMPLFSPGLAQFLLTQGLDCDVVVPELDGYLEPLCAVYTKNCLEAIDDCLRTNIRQIIKFYPRVRVHRIPGESLARFGCTDELFYNMNTPEDYQQLFERLNGAAPVKKPS